MNLASARSLLFAPGNDERKLRRALDSPADVVVADLEDSVPRSEKAAARETIRQIFTSSAADRLRSIRIDAADPGDVALVTEIADSLHAVVVPKALSESCGRVAACGLPVLAIVETAAGVVHALETAATPGVLALCLGNLDLTAELQLTPRADGAELALVRSQLVVASAAAGLRSPFDGVQPDFSDLVALRAEIELARSLGFRGKICIHPGQVDAVNVGFGPTEAERAWAEQVLEASARASSGGAGVTVVDGAMVDVPVVERARRMLEE